MTILDNFLARIGYAKAHAAPVPVPGELLALAGSYKWDMSTADGAGKQAQLYAAVNWISAAIERVAEFGGVAQFSVTRQAGPDDADTDIPNHPFELLLRHPNPDQSGSEFLRDVISWFKLTGNAYIFLNATSEGAPPDELWIVPSQMMRPLPDGASFIRGYEFTPNGQRPIFVDAWRILHLKTFNPLNPFVGLSAVQALALDAYGDIEQQKWNLALFGKNNGKFPGILAFKHAIADPEWSKLKATRDTEWGGSNRPGVVMLRGVGDTIQWLPAGFSQKDMEFLGGRNFTKEMIYGRLAPGLASILAVNATEANAIAGKAILIEFGVWPILEQIGQKFSAKILALYGPDLVGTFDDLRQTNRILDLQEQTEYAKYHTVNEVRAEYYGDDPLYLDKSQMEHLADNEAAAAERSAQALAQFGKVDATPEAQSTVLDPRGLMFAAQIGPSTPLPGEKQAAPPMMFPAQPPMMQQPGAAGSDLVVPNADPAAELAELAKWEKFAIARAGKGGREFEPRRLPLFQAARINTALKAAVTVAEVHAVFQRERETPGLLDVAVKLTAAIEQAVAKL